MHTQKIRGFRRMRARSHGDRETQRSGIMMMTAGMPKCPIDQAIDRAWRRERERARGRHRELAAAICMRRCTRGCSVFPHTHSVNSVQSTSVDRSGCIKTKPFSGRGQLFLLRSCVNRMPPLSPAATGRCACATPLVARASRRSGGQFRVG